MLATAFALRYKRPFSAGLCMAAELAGLGKRGMGVDVRFSESDGAQGEDVEEITGTFTPITPLLV